MDAIGGEGNKGYIRNNALHDLIFLDLVFITVSLIFQIPDEILYYIQVKNDNDLEKLFENYVLYLSIWFNCLYSSVGGILHRTY